MEHYVPRSFEFGAKTPWVAGEGLSGRITVILHNKQRNEYLHVLLQ